MKETTRVTAGALLASLAIILGGCSEVGAPSDTVKAVERCIDKNKTALLPGTLIRDRCAEKQSKTIGDVIEGRAAYSGDDNEMGSFNGTLKNASKDFVVTSVVVVVTHEDAPKDGSGKVIPLRYAVSGLWIMPDGSETFSVPKDRLKFIPTRDRALKGPDGKFHYEWDVASIRGVAILE